MKIVFMGTPDFARDSLKAVVEAGHEVALVVTNPDKPKGKHNNRKQSFDAICRELLFEICKKHGLHLDREPEYGGRAY